MSRTMRLFIIWLQVSLQLLMPLVISGAHAASWPFSADRSQVGAGSNTAPVMSYDGTGGNATGMATGIASFAVGDAVEQWLHQYGTAQMDLRTDTRLSSLEGSSLDLLIPLLDTPKDVFFTQGGVRYHDDHITTNLGLGHRHFIVGWMLGYNAFYDATWNNINRRWGLGLEAWRDNLRLSSNLYQGISGWHNSRQHEGYDERPADGWDVRVDGWLPAYPQLGMKAVYEQYYGNNVALFNSFSDRQNNPHSVTVGLNYTPVPLITVGVEQKMGKGGVNDTQFTAGLNYRIGEPWSKQVSAAGVAALRDICNSRLELVNRNNEIVLDYRKKTELKLSFPPRLTGEEGAVVTFTPTIKASNGVDHLELNDSALLQAGGQVISVNNTAVTLRMPAYQTQPVRLNGVAVDRKGNHSNVAEMLLVTTQKETVLTMTTDKTQASADGSDAIVATLYMADRSGTALTNQTVSWHATGGQLTATSAETDRNGNATVKLSSTTPGSFTITGTAGGKTATTEALHFTSVARAQIAVDKTSVTADDTDAATYTVTVRNASNQPVSGQTVTWTTSLGNLTTTSGTTDDSGQLTVKLTSATAGQATVTATTAGQTVTAPVVTFTAEVLTPSLTVDKTSVTADDTDAATYTVTVRNASNQPVSGQTVTWTTSLGNLATTSGTTDDSGQLTVKLTSATAGQATVTATTAGQTVTAPVVTFTAEVLTPSLTVDKTSVTADDTDAATYTVTVRNASNQPVSGQTVTWTTSLGNLATTSGTTDDSGQLTVKLTSATAGQATVTATTAGQTVTAPVVTFKALLGEISLDVPTLTGNVINMVQSFTAQYTTRYSGMQAGDVITLSFNGFDTVGQRFTGSDSHTVTAAETSTGKVVMGPYSNWLQGIQGTGISKNGTFTSTVTRPSTGESKSVSVTVTVDTVGS